MKKTNKSGIIFIKKQLTDKNNALYLCECPICKNTFEMWASHYYRGDNPCRCTHYALKSKRLYSIWTNIKSRCNNSNVPGYKNYGGRGIKICSEWQEKFECFYKWAISNGYKDNLSIDRIDVNGNYEPSNCRWVTRIEQSQNKRNTIRINYNNETLSLRRVCDILGLNYKSEHSFLRCNGYIAEVERLSKYIKSEE